MKTTEEFLKTEPVAKVGYCEPSVRCTGLQPWAKNCKHPYGLLNCIF
jgi:hypothetical protein